MKYYIKCVCFNPQLSFVISKHLLVALIQLHVRGAFYGMHYIFCWPFYIMFMCSTCTTFPELHVWLTFMEKCIYVYTHRLLKAHLQD